jgi:hypothetical protein
MNSIAATDSTNGMAPANIGSTNVSGSHNHQLRTLLTIKRFSAGLQEHGKQLEQIANDLTDFSEKSLILLGVGNEAGNSEKWKEVLDKINSRAYIINMLLETANKKVAAKVRTDSTDLWQQIEEQIEMLEATCKEIEDMADIGPELLTNGELKNWKAHILNFKESILPLFVSHAMAYKVELQMIEKYTPEELSKVTQTIMNNIPDNFTFAEAEKYEREYLKAMDDLEKELGQEKNLWDTFLDILAGGTHQTPAERVMLNRWVEGEKGDLTAETETK